MPGLMPGGGPIPGDPAALEAGARVYGAVAEAWLALSGEVANLAFGLASTPDWVGEAAVAFSAAARELVEAAERGSAAMREGAGALRAYAVALEQAQAASAAASADQATAEAERARAGDALRGVPGGSLLPLPLLSRLDMADAGVAAAARAVTGAMEQAEQAGREAAAAFRAVAAQADAVGQVGTPAEWWQEGGGVLGALVRAGNWLSEQTVEFAEGFREGVVGLWEGLVTLAKLGPLWYAFDPEGTRQAVIGIGTAIQFAIEQPGEFAQAAANWEDLEEGRYAEWLGNFGPDAIIAGLTMGYGAAATAGGRGLRVVNTLDNAMVRANPLWFRHGLKGINPGYRADLPKDPRSINCSRCVIALDSSLAGRPATAMPYVGMSTPELAKYFNSKFEMISRDPIRGMFAIQEQLLEAGPDARGIVYGSRGSLKAGHVFNAINDDGVVRFLDGQSGTSARFTDQGYRWIEFMRTN